MLLRLIAMFRQIGHKRRPTGAHLSWIILASLGLALYVGTGELQVS